MLKLQTEPRLLLHYAPGILAVLRRNHCLTTNHYDDHGCNRDTHTYHTIVSVHLVQGEEASWCLERSWIRPK